MRLFVTRLRRWAALGAATALTAGLTLVGGAPESRAVPPLISFGLDNPQQGAYQVSETVSNETINLSRVGTGFIFQAMTSGGYGSMVLFSGASDGGGVRIAMPQRTFDFHGLTFIGSSFPESLDFVSDKGTIATGVTTNGTMDAPTQITFDPSGADANAQGVQWVEMTASHWGGLLQIDDVVVGNAIGVPSAPTNVVATPGDATASVSFDPPASSGGSAVTNYVVTASPGGLTGSGASSPITVTGLTNDTAYTFTVTATNTSGTSDPSDPSASVTPTGATTTTTSTTSTTTTTTSTTSTTTTTTSATTTSTTTTLAPGTTTTTMDPGTTTTLAPTTVAPTTVAPTTVAPTTVAPTTVEPTTTTTEAPTPMGVPVLVGPVTTTVPPTTAPATTTTTPTTVPPTTTTLSPQQVADLTDELLRGLDDGTIDPTTVVVVIEGGHIHISFTAPRGFVDFEIWLHSNPILLGAARADSNGKVSFDADIPGGVSGDHHVVVKSMLNGAMINDAAASIPVSIAPPPPVDLAFTGASTIATTLAGVVLVVCGLALTRVRRRRTS